MQRNLEDFFDDIILSWQGFQLALRKYMKHNMMTSLPSFSRISLSRIEPKILGFMRTILLLLVHIESFDPSCIASCTMLLIMQPCCSIMLSLTFFDQFHHATLLLCTCSIMLPTLTTLHFAATHSIMLITMTTLLYHSQHTLPTSHFHL